MPKHILIRNINLNYIKISNKIIMIPIIQMIIEKQSRNSIIKDFYFFNDVYFLNFDIIIL